MMKRIVVVAAVMAVVASSAMAASLLKIDPVGTNTASQVNALTNDGAYAVGTSGVAFLWKASDGSVTSNILAGSYMNTGTGIGYRTVGGVKQLVLGGKMSSGQVGVFTSSDDGATWVRPYATSGSAPGTSGFNSIGGSGADDTAYFAWQEGSAVAYSVTQLSGDPTVAGTATKNVTTGIGITGMSNTGLASAWRKDSTGARQNTTVQYTTAGGTAAQTFFNGLAGTLVGQASAVSGDGTAVFGQSPIVAGGTDNYPYKYTVGGSIEALPLLAGTTGSVSLGYIYGASADGRYAVGMDYVGMERAALWDTQTGTVTDLTTFATDAGILGGFTGNLRRAYTVGVNAQGQPVIGGMGIYYDEGSTVALTRGFILTVPEPATLSFLAIGALAMLRRRR